MKHWQTLIFVAGAACAPESESTEADIATALPTAEQLRIKLPANSAAAQARAPGETSKWYVATRDVTRTLNGGTAWVLGLVHLIVQFPATSVDGDTSVWGPHSDALDPSEWKLSVTALGDGSYDWKLESRSKTQANAVFETLTHGNAVPSVPAGRGTGTFTVDFDAARRVDPTSRDAGVMTATYDLSARHLEIDAETPDESQQLVATHYEYDEADDGGGSMLLSLTGDTEDEGALPEVALVHSRWLATGAGRADVRLTSGDLTAEVTASECWSTMFARVYYTDSAEWQPTEGDVSACAFADVSLP